MTSLAAVDQIGQREIDVGKRLLGRPQWPGCRQLFSTLTCLTSKTLWTTWPSLIHLLVRQAGNVDGLLELTLELLAVLWIVLCDQNAIRIQRDREDVRHIEQHRHSLLVGRVLEIKAQILPWNGLVEGGANAVAGIDLTKDVLLSRSEGRKLLTPEVG